MIKVGVVDDHHLVRKSVVSLINRFKGISVELEAQDGNDFFKKIEYSSIDILLLDIQMPGMDGYETCKIVSNKHPEIKILMVSQLIAKENISKAIRLGAHGYFSKFAEASHLENALRTIDHSGFYFDPSLSSSLHDIILWDKDIHTEINPLSTLSEREMQLIILVCNGYNNIEIAEKMSINLRTVESYRKRILDKADAPNFTSIVLMAIKYKYANLKDLLVRTI